jgi:hypothetical protein
MVNRGRPPRSTRHACEHAGLNYEHAWTAAQTLALLAREDLDPHTRLAVAQLSHRDTDERDPDYGLGLLDWTTSLMLQALLIGYALKDTRPWPYAEDADTDTQG